MSRTCRLDVGMSDTSQGEGWWRASDGKWYPPEEHPGQSAPTPYSPAGPNSAGPKPSLWRRFRNQALWKQIAAWGVGAVIVIGVISAAADGGGSGNNGTSDTAGPTTSVEATTTTTGATSTTTGATSATTVPSTSAATPTIGSTLKLRDGRTVQLLAFGPATPARPSRTTPGDTIVAAEVQGCVPSTSAQSTFNPLRFSLGLADHRRLSAELGSVEGQISSDQVPPGDCLKGKVGFEVPSGSKPVAFYFETYRREVLKWNLA